MITIYSKNNCQACDQAKNYLKNHGVAYEEVKIDQVPAAREFLLNEGHRSVPQIYKGGSLFVDNGLIGLRQMPVETLKTTA